MKRCTIIEFSEYEKRGKTPPESLYQKGGLGVVQRSILRLIRKMEDEEIEFYIQKIDFEWASKSASFRMLPYTKAIIYQYVKRVLKEDEEERNHEYR